jgi:hypothetical protein
MCDVVNTFLSLSFTILSGRHNSIAEFAKDYLQPAQCRALFCRAASIDTLPVYEIIRTFLTRMRTLMAVLVDTALYLRVSEERRGGSIRRVWSIPGAGNFFVELNYRQI